MKGTRWIKQVMRNGATLRDSRGKWHSELWTSEKSYSRERRQEAQCLWGGDLYGAIKMQQRVCVAAAGSQEEVQQEDAVRSVGFNSYRESNFTQNKME